jgi:TolB-like protein/Tfp pilus assembly protein PilF
MPPASRNSRSVFRFGPFELDSQSGELRRDHVPVKLPPQPLKILISLASHPGDLQTREEIRNLVWKSATFVDFELGLNGCLNQIRKVLGDDARKPRYIETMPRRGYRFIAPVQTTVHVPQAADAPPSIAVLPFANLSSDRENAYFGDGLADEVITALTRIPGLRVTARTSSFAFRGKQKDVREIGAKLGVRTLLEGSVQRSNNRVRVSAQLVSVADGFHLWSQHFDRKVTNAFSIQDEISRAIAHALEVRLAPLPEPRPIANLKAYNCWLTARHYRHGENLGALQKCRTCLEQAIAHDPLFTQAYVGLADFFLGISLFGVMSPREALAQGRKAIERAFQLDNASGDLYALSAAYRAWMDFDWPGAGSDFDRALELTPASEQAHTLRANYYLVPTGNLREAEQEMETALESNPLSPLAYIDLVKVLVWERDFDRAQARMQTAFELWPDYALAKWFMGVALYFQGKLEEALALWQPAMQKIGSTPAMRGAIGMALGQLGRHVEARRMLADMEAEAGNSYVPSLSRAQIHVGLGEFDAALYLLDRAVDERDPHLLDLPHKPIWDCLRTDPRFTAILHRMQLLERHLAFMASRQY